MIIKSDKELVAVYLAVMFSVMCVMCWLAATADNVIVPGVYIPCGVAIALDVYMFVTKIIFNCRTLIMDKEGCTIRIGKFNKKYKWAELKTRRLEYYCVQGRDSRRGVVFSKRRIWSMNWSHPSKHAGVKPLLSCFYVIFPVSEDERTEKSEKPFETKYYEVDEQYFMSKMHEWGVKIENGLPPEKRKKYPWDWA